MRKAPIVTEIAINGRFLTQPVTGVQRYARELLAAFDALSAERSDLHIRLLTPPVASEKVPVLKHIRHEVVGRRQGHRWEQLELPRHVRGGILFCPGNTAPVLSLLSRRRVVVTVHDLSYLYFPDAYRRSFRFLYHRLIPLILRRSDKVITVSNSERAAILQHYPFAERCLEAIQNGGLPYGIPQQATVQAEIPTILYVGSLSKRKNFPGAFEAAVRMARTRNVRSVFIGSVPQGLTATASTVPDDVKDYIHFTGQVNEWSHLIAEYRSAHCFLFPSFYEASPLPPIEAMGCGCPVVAGDIPSLRERCGDAAEYCDPTNIDDIVMAISNILDDTDHAERLRAAGYARAQEYSWRHCAERTLDVIIGKEAGA